MTGSVLVTGTAGTLNLNGVRSISGDLSITQVITLTSFSAPSLQSISGTFRLVNLTILNSLNMPQLTTVGDIDWEILPALQTPTFGGITQADNILITDTQLSSLNFFNLNNVGDFNINNNFYLQSVSQSNLMVVRSALSIAFNGPQLACNFPNLVTMQNGTFRQAASVTLSSLNNVTGDLGFIQNSFSTILLPNLTSIQSSLSFVNNSGLNNVTAPQLKSVGGTLLIANNSNYNDIEFNTVTDVGGSVDWTGTFSKASLSSITTIRGGLNVQTTANNFTCPFDSLRSNGVVQGNTFVCTGNITAPKVGTNGTNVTANSGGGSNTSSTSGSGSSSSTSDAGHILANGVFLVGTAIFGLLASYVL